MSDYEIEDRLNDSVSFSRFCGLSIEDISPDHSTLSRFRTTLTQTKGYEKIMKALNKQLESHKIIVKTGVIVDASIIDSPFKPKGKVSYKIVEDRAEAEPTKENQEFEKKKKYFKPRC